MLISPELRKALLISFIWHLCLISFVVIVLPQGNFLPRQDMAVHFLGSVLTSPIPLAVAADQKTVTELPFTSFSAQSSYFSAQPNSSLPLERGTLNPDNFLDLRPDAAGICFAASFVQDKSYALEPEIIFKPEFVQYPEWLHQVKSSNVIFKIYISTEGLVEQVINIRASGNPEFDVALARYVEKWRFAPRFSSQGQWQTVQIDLKQ